MTTAEAIERLRAMQTYALEQAKLVGRRYPKDAEALQLACEALEREKS